MTFSCRCNRAKLGPWDRSQCSRCWTRLNVLGETFTTAKAEPCRYLGKATGELRECPSCTGKVSRKVFACSEPSGRHPLVVLRDCERCSERE